MWRTFTTGEVDTLVTRQRMTIRVHFDCVCIVLLCIRYKKSSSYIAMYLRTPATLLFVAVYRRVTASYCAPKPVLATTNFHGQLFLSSSEGGPTAISARETRAPRLRKDHGLRHNFRPSNIMYAFYLSQTIYAFTRSAHVPR